MTERNSDTSDDQTQANKPDGALSISPTPKVTVRDEVFPEEVVPKEEFETEFSEHIEQSELEWMEARIASQAVSKPETVSEQEATPAPTPQPNTRRVLPLMLLIFSIALIGIPLSKNSNNQNPQESFLKPRTFKTTEKDSLPDILKTEVHSEKIQPPSEPTSMAKVLPKDSDSSRNKPKLRNSEVAKLRIGEFELFWKDGKWTRIDKPKKIVKEKPKEVRLEPEVFQENVPPSKVTNPKKTSVKESRNVSKGGFGIQVAAFTDLKEATDLQDEIQKSFHLPSFIEKAVVKGTTYHRVLVGPYPKKSIAQEMKQELISVSGECFRSSFLRSVSYVE